MLAGHQASARGDGPRALELCDQALAAGGRLGPVPDWDLLVWTLDLRAFVAQGAGALDEAVVHWLEAARLARVGEFPGFAAMFLALAQGVLSSVDPAAALERGTEGLALARQTGMPTAIAINLLYLAQTLATDDPDRARALLDEALELAATLGYENEFEVGAAIFAAARLGAWPTMLQLVSRQLRLQLRSGTVATFGLAGTLNLTARALAQHRPEPAAVLQGKVAAVIRRFVPAAPPAATGSVESPPPNPAMAFATTARWEATQILVAVLGDARMRELRAQGAAMDEDAICAYARRHIGEYLATLDDDA
jgi:hypothetical protein